MADPKQESIDPYLYGKSDDDEATFQKWYADYAKRLNLDPNPDAPEHFYDYRRAYREGTGPGADRHWPSEYKRLEHPNRFVGNEDTISGQKVPKGALRQALKANAKLRSKIK